MQSCSRSLVARHCALYPPDSVPSRPVRGRRRGGWGWCISGIPEGGLWPAFGPGDLGAVDWRVVAGQVPTLLTVTLVTLLCLLVYVNGLEVATGVEVDLNRGFRVAGLASMCAGAGGSGLGCHAFVFTLPCRMLGADTPWTGVVVAVVLTLSLFFGSGILELLPMSIIGSFAALHRGRSAREVARPGAREAGLVGLQPD